MKPMLILFKTHLDIGFTDYAETIVSNYMERFIPAAIELGNELKGSDTPFVWSVGSWLIDRALRQDKTGAVEQAIRDGILHWHGLPFTTHTELMSPKLFAKGLQIAQDLNQRFGKQTIAAKLTDVPGHTIGMVPLMAQAGIRFLHLGINPATPLPPVPPLFRWKCGEDSIVVMYQGDYGEVAEFDEFAVYFAHTGDNKGPSSKEDIQAMYADLRERYPQYALQAATLDDLAEYVCRIPHLPVLENEIGDTWIHGAATDPQKLSRYRRLLRALETADDVDVRDDLLLVPEHTWGMCVQLHFNNLTHFTADEMEQIPEERAKIEKSWVEQRSYVEKVEKRLGLASEYPIAEPDMTGWQKIDPIEPGFEVSWQIFDRSDYERYKERYIRMTEKNHTWATWDFTKNGLPEYVGGTYTAQVIDTYANGEGRRYLLRFPEEAAKEYGLPYFWAEEQSGEISLRWFGKRIDRRPQACWFKLKGCDERWELNKMGQWIVPESIVGSPLIVGVDQGVRNHDLEIRPLDSALVAPFGRKLLDYGSRGSRQDLYFNLYNNIWNTNFPMWYSDDSMFRFQIIRTSAK